MKQLIKFFIRLITKAPGLENFLLSKASGKTLESFWVKLLPRHHQYTSKDLRHIERNGIKYELYLNNYDEHLLYFGVVDNSFEALYDLVKDGDVVFNIGTNIGETTLNIAKRNPSGKIYGFEPVDFTFKKLNKNIQLNGFTNIETFNYAVSDQNEKVYYSIEEKRGHSGGIFMTKDLGDIMYSAKAVSIDYFIQKRAIPRLDVLKISVLGFDYNVLKGAEQSILKFRPKIFIELNSSKLAFQGRSCDEIVEYIRSLHYTLYGVDGREWVSSCAGLKKVTLVGWPK